MRRVVITGLGMVSPVGCGVGGVVVSALSRGKAARAASTEFEVDDLACQIALLHSARRRRPTASSIPTIGWSPRSSARSTTSSSTRWRPPTQAIADSGYEADTTEKQERTGVLIGSGIGGLSGIADTSHPSA